MAYTPCSVVDSRFCEAPANYAGHSNGSAKHTCFVCCSHVCKNCSLIVDYYNYGKQRLCHNCLEDYDENDERVLTHLSQMNQ
jgi:hypothetical protein